MEKAEGWRKKGFEDSRIRGVRKAKDSRIRGFEGSSEKGRGMEV